MTDERGKGIFSKIFGPKKSCCCGMKIEEVSAEQAGEPENGRASIEEVGNENSATAKDTNQDRQPPSCCGR